MTFLLAQLSDLHVIGPDHEGELYVDNNHRLELAVARLRAETVPPDAVLLSGDLTDRGTREEMDILLRLLEPLDVPLYPVPGNHDRRLTFRASFDLPYSGEDHLSWVVDVGPVNLIGLDSLVAHQISANGVVDHRGRFDEPRARWLDRVLSETSGRPAALAMHHPPFATGIGWMDALGLDNRELFAEVVAGHDHLTRIFCGHIHRPITTLVGGVLTSTGPSTVQQVELDLQPGAPPRIVCDAPGYQLHRFDGSTWTTHTRHFDSGAEVIVPSWA